jgi:hypothetical protein
LIVVWRTAIGVHLPGTFINSGRTVATIRPTLTTTRVHLAAMSRARPPPARERAAFRLLPWQVFVIGSIFGWMKHDRKTGLERHRLRFGGGRV